MIESDGSGAEHPDVLAKTDADAVPAKAGGGKTMTVFGALFGAAAAVPS